MRKARKWFGGYRATSIEEHRQICPQGSETDAYFRMVTSYWDMVASFLTSGVLNKELFYQSGNELLFVWAKVSDMLSSYRTVMGPRALLNLQAAAQEHIDYIEAQTPGYYEAFSKRVKTLGASAAQSGSGQSS